MLIGIGATRTDYLYQCGHHADARSVLILSAYLSGVAELAAPTAANALNVLEDEALDLVFALSSTTPARRAS